MTFRQHEMTQDNQGGSQPCTMACRSDPGAGAGGQGADAPALLSEDAAGQKVKVSSCNVVLSFQVLLSVSPV